MNFFSWWRLVPVRHTNSPRNPRGFPRYNFRNPRGNLVFVVETDPRPTPYNSGIPGDSWVAYWLGLEIRGGYRPTSAPYNAEVASNFRLEYWLGTFLQRGLCSTVYS